VIDRWIPLVTAAYGTQVARPARTTVARGGNGSQLDQRMRPALDDHRLVGKLPKAARQEAGSQQSLPVEGAAVKIRRSSCRSRNEVRDGLLPSLCRQRHGLPRPVPDKTEDELMKHVELHVAEAHPDLEMTPENQAMIKGLVRTS
jgi:hypothetical protein